MSEKAAPRTIWWWLAMTFHAEPTPGHACGKAKDCWQCQRFAEIHRKAKR